MEKKRALRNRKPIQKGKEEGEDLSQFLSFYLGKELFAVEIKRIKEIIEYHGTTHIPMMAQFIEGVINLRGNVVPVINLSLRFERVAKSRTKRTSVVIVEANSDEGLLQIGMVVDKVDEVVDIPISKIEAPPEFGTKIRSEFIKGIGKIGDKFVMILNIDNVFNVEELADNDDISQDDRLDERFKEETRMSLVGA